ncbi:MAG: radical SAM protein [Desulfatibacillaceae bacterium]|nr:radical SAM protein [Desulfatibacillaceae bacterium]
MSGRQPGYVKLLATGELEKRVEQAVSRLEDCTLCPRACRVNRLKDERGFCKTGRNALVSSFGPHFGEEAPLVGKHGSGTIFFTYCNLLCVFCQNFDISHQGDGQEVSRDQLAWVMEELARQKCPNENFVTPSHVVPQILEALLMAAKRGFNLPLVYNSGGYDSVETLKLLDGVFDIYMPDFKFWESSVAEKACSAPDYPQRAKEALMEMHCQVGDLALDEKGLAYKGLLLRHLVMPNNMAGTDKIFEFVAQKISRQTYLNVMPQYRPLGRYDQMPGIERPITEKEFEQALESARRHGLDRLDERRRTFLASF